MALTHSIVEIREYYTSWIAIVDITDTDTQKMYHYRFNFDHEPLEAEVLVILASKKSDILLEIEYEDNSMNLTNDEERAVDFLRDIKREIVTQIRAFPAVTLVQAQAYIDANYPNSIINFAKLYQFYLNLLGLNTWAEFKTFCIDHRFRDID